MLDELVQGGGDGCRAGLGASADLALRQRLHGLGERLHDALLRGIGLGVGVGLGLLAQTEGRSMAVIGEFELDIRRIGKTTCRFELLGEHWCGRCQGRCRCDRSHLAVEATRLSGAGNDRSQPGRGRR